MAITLIQDFCALRRHHAYDSSASEEVHVLKDYVHSATYSFCLFPNGDMTHSFEGSGAFRSLIHRH